MFSVARFTATRKKQGYGEVIHFPVEFETFLALQAVYVEVG